MDYVAKSLHLFARWSIYWVFIAAAVFIMPGGIYDDQKEQAELRGFVDGKLAGMWQVERDAPAVKGQPKD